jgi:hypothetical protein
MDIKAIHPGGEVVSAALILNHVYRPRRIQEDVSVRPIELRQLRHTNCHLGYARSALANQPIGGKPRAASILLHVLAEPYIHRIMVLRHIPIDIVEPSIADLNIDLAMEKQVQEPHKSRYHCCSSTSLQPC